MKKNYKEYLELLTSDKSMLLNYLKARFPLFNNSNFFFRDLQYGIKSFLEMKDFKVTYKQAEDLAVAISTMLEKESIFIKINNETWKVNFPEFAAAAPGDPF